jgi:hypothetical protein
MPRQRHVSIVIKINLLKKNKNVYIYIYFKKKKLKKKKTTKKKLKGWVGHPQWPQGVARPQAIGGGPNHPSGLGVSARHPMWTKGVAQPLFQLFFF